MAKLNYESWLDELNKWLLDVKNHEIAHFVENFNQTQEEIAAYSKQQMQDYAYYLKRDYQHWRENHEQYNALANAELKESLWLTLSQLVDKSQVEWRVLLDDFEHHGVYQQGEWVAFGEIVCRSCGDVHCVTHPEKLRKCQQCQGFNFMRRPFSP